MRHFGAFLTILLAALLFAAPAVAWTDERDLRPAVLTTSDSGVDYTDAAVLLVRGGHGGHRGDGHDRVFRGGQRHDFDRHFSGHRHHQHFRSDMHRHHFRHFDGRYGYVGRPHLHHGFGVSFCFRDAGVLVCFSDRSFGHRSHW